MLPALLRQSAPPEGELGAGCSLVLVLLLFVVLLLVGLIRGKFRSKTAPPPRPPGQVKAELERALGAGLRDVRGEAHVRAFLNWSRLWALLEFVGFALFLTRAVPDPESPREFVGWTASMTVVSAALWIGMWVSGNAVRRGSDRARVLYGMLATALGLSLAFTLAFDPRPWASDPRSRFVHAFMALYSITGASFLYLPRCARLFTPEYREAAAREAAALSPEAQGLALVRSPFSWVPIASFLSSLVVQFALERTLGG
jgi:hypothetical protein